MNNPSPSPEDQSDKDMLEQLYGGHFAQDPNEDDDSGMSFDSTALHNLDT